MNIVLSGGAVGWLRGILFPVVPFLMPPEQPAPNVSLVVASTFDRMTGLSADYRLRPKTHVPDAP